MKRGKTKDYLSGKLRPDTPEEKVRQAFVKKLHKEYGYPKEHMETEFPIQRGVKGKKPEAADIAIFNNKNHDQNNVFIIIETKKPTETNPDYQASSYVNATTAVWCGWTNGIIELFWKTNIGTIDVTKFTEVHDIPRYGQRLGAPSKNKLVKPDNLTTLFQNMHDWIHANSNIKKPDRITTNIINVLFCKIYDELSPSKDCEFYTVLNNNQQPDANKTHTNLLNLFVDVKKKYSDVFYKSDSIEFNKKTISYLVPKLQKYALMYSDVDAIGGGFEVFLTESLKKELGQFFTPRQIVKFAVGLIDPQPEEKILDPACGSGGFLIETLHKISKILDNRWKALPKSQRDTQKRRIFAQNFFGIDQEIDLAKISKAYMAIVGDGSGGIFSEDSLDAIKSWNNVSRPELDLHKFDVVLTNPPFGKEIKVTDKHILSQFDLAHTWKTVTESGQKKIERMSKPKNAVRPSLLFLERCFQFLNEKNKGARMCIVLPVGDLSNDEDWFVRTWLMQNTEIFAIVQLPNQTFQPYTGTQTCLVFLRPIEKSSYSHKVFMAQVEKVGKDQRGKVIYKRKVGGSLDLDNDGKKVIDDHLEDILDEYKKFERGKKFTKKFSFSVNGKKLFENLLPNYHNPKHADLIAKFKGKRKVETKTLNKLCEQIYTPPRTARIYVDKEYGVPFLSGTHITQIIPQNLKYISKTETENLEQYIVHEGDIVIVRVGTMGIIRMIGKDLDGYAVSDNLTIIRVNKKEIEPEYISAMLYSKIGRTAVKKSSKGSVQHYNTVKAIKAMKIPILAEPEHTQIVNFMKDYNKKLGQAVNNIFNFVGIIDSFVGR